MAATIVAGDSKLYAVTLYMPGGTEAFAINPVTDSVQVAIVSLDRKTSYTQPVEASSTTAGADWEHSKIVFKFSRAGGPVIFSTVLPPTAADMAWLIPSWIADEIITQPPTP